LSAQQQFEANIVPWKNQDKFNASPSGFFLFLRLGTSESLEFDHFPVKIDGFATCNLTAESDSQNVSIPSMHPADCGKMTAPSAALIMRRYSRYR